jgi:hypothetical protein
MVQFGFCKINIKVARGAFVFFSLHERCGDGDASLGLRYRTENFLARDLEAGSLSFANKVL